MTCSICLQSGHNKRTCSFVIKYTYDDCDVKCRINPADETDIQPCEPYCYPCGAKTEDCDCGNYKLGKWFNEDKGKWEGGFKPKRAPRAPRAPAPAPAPAPKSACADCGQIETECRLKLVGGKIMCCDCLEPKEDIVFNCADCGTAIIRNSREHDDCWTDVEMDDDVWYCGDCKCDHMPNDDDFDEEPFFKTEEEEEDTCECCGRPYDHRNPHRQSEMCDCVQNDDGTLSRPAEEEEDEGESDDSWEPDCCKCRTTTDSKGMGGVELREDLNGWYCGRCYEYHKRPTEPEPVVVLCDDCGDVIPDPENLDKCWTNDLVIYWCSSCRDPHVEEYICERDGEEE